MCTLPPCVKDVELFDDPEDSESEDHILDPRMILPILSTLTNVRNVLIYDVVMQSDTQRPLWIVAGLDAKWNKLQSFKLDKLQFCASRAQGRSTNGIIRTLSDFLSLCQFKCQSSHANIHANLIQI